MKRMMIGTITLIGLVGGCSDSTEPTNFDPATTNAKAQAVMSAFDDNAALTSIGVLGQYVADLGGGLPALALDAPFEPTANPATGAEYLRTAQALLPSFATAPSLAIFPSDLLGKTFVFDPDSGYVLDPVATGAPADGIRLILYAVDPILGQVVTPLQPIGTLDFIDVSSASADAIRLVAVVGSVTYLDYTSSLSVATSSVTLAAEGFLANGSAQVDFDLSLTATQSTVDLDYQLSNDEGAIRFQATLTDENDYSAVLRLTSGDDQAVLTLDVTPSTVSGQVTYNGDVVVNIAGTPAEPTFTRPDGSALTENEAAALEAFGAIIGVLFEAFDNLLLPAAVFLVLA